MPSSLEDALIVNGIALSFQEDKLVCDNVHKTPAEGPKLFRKLVQSVAIASLHFVRIA